LEPTDTDFITTSKDPGWGLMLGIQSLYKLTHRFSKNLCMNGFKPVIQQFFDVLKFQGVGLDNTHRPVLKHPFLRV
jgi:hypothetical protein